MSERTDYISREAIAKRLEEMEIVGPLYYGIPVVEVLEAIREAPASDVRENVPARWERGPWGEDTLGPLLCSNCGGWGNPNYKFCPYCGAKMREDAT